MNLKQLFPDVKEAYDCSCVLPRYVLNQPQQSPRYCISRGPREKVQRRRLVMFLLRSDCVVFCFCDETVPSVKWRQGHRRIAPASLYCIVSLMKSACNDGNWPPPKNASDSASPSGSSVHPCTPKFLAEIKKGIVCTGQLRQYTFAFHKSFQGLRTILYSVKSTLDSVQGAHVKQHRHTRISSKFHRKPFFLQQNETHLRGDLVLFCLVLTVGKTMARDHT